MGLRADRLPVTAYAGAARACGRAYGEEHREAIIGFLHMETAPNPKRLRYAAKCWQRLRRWHRPIADFVRGSAEGAALAVEDLVLLLLHEEVQHQPHCTGLGATGEATRDGHAVIGQNWDWNARLYPWSRLHRLRIAGMPAMLTYAYPGLWASAGINEHGLSLVWTGGGYRPQVAPKVGIPTYALIAGILACRTCAEAVALVERTANAGCFLFFLADARDELWLIEGVGGKAEAVRCADVVGRANHYELPATMRRAKQGEQTPNTEARGARIAALLRRHRGRIDRAAVEGMLRDTGAPAGQTICQIPNGQRGGTTIDAFYCLPAKRELWLARGVPNRHEFLRYTVK